MSLARLFESSKRIYRRKKNILGEGGNSIVCQVEDDGQVYALKSRKKGLSSKQNERFIREIDILKDIQHFEGIVKIVDWYAGDEKQEPFYVMDVAVPSLSWVKGKEQVQIIGAFYELAKILKNLEQNSIAHRDIKPENILFIEGRPILSDFGLAYREGDDRITCEGDRQVGAKMTMPPEMLRNPFSADFHKADVYSYAKTLWMLITGDIECFDGTYSTHGKESLWNYSVEVLGDIEVLLSACTSNDPKDRWSYDEIVASLEKWIFISTKSRARENEAWRLLRRRIFPFIIPEIAEWTELDDILKVFKLVVEKPCWNHAFFPTGGGLDLKDVKKSHEDGCIEFLFGGSANIIKPKKLSFYSPGGDEHGEQDYFILEVDDLDFISPNYSEHREFLTQLSPSLYTHPWCGEWDDYNGEVLPEMARQVCRWSKGKFGIFMNASIYDRKGVVIGGKHIDSYSAPHNDIDSSVLFDFFKKLYAKDEFLSDKIEYIEPTTTRLKNILLNSDQVKVIRQFIDACKGSEHEKDIIVDSLCDEDLALITAVMYGGRDNNPPFGDSLDEKLAEHCHAKENRFSLKGKSVQALLRYIEDGLKMYM